VIVRQRHGAVIRQLRSLYNIGTIGDLTDVQLLERFATGTNEAAELAFAALVERHEAMVWRVCLAILRDEHEAEDAFQASFLVLVRKARSLWVRDSLGPWLHQVAWRTASYLQRTGSRRRKHEKRSAKHDATRSVSNETPHDPDLQAAVHEEVNRLPAKYREPVVLCDLEGRTHQEAARCLGWPIGTVKSRQSHGRKLIRDGLARRGFELVLAGAVVESLRQTTVAAISRHVSRSTVSAALRHSARLVIGFSVSAHVLTLTQGVLRTMFCIRFRFLAVTTLAGLLAAGSASVYVRGSPQQQAQQEQTPPQSKIAQPAAQPASGTQRSRLLAQQLATRKARALADIAKANRELAEVALQEYEEITYPRDMNSSDAEIMRAESERKRVQDRLDWARRMHDKGYVSKEQKVSEELSFEKAKFALEQAQSKLHVLVHYSKGKTVKELRSELEKARSDAVARLATWEREKIKELELARQLNLETK
jgi:RNA polymerase sigma factor (sigma-70 family)